MRHEVICFNCRRPSPKTGIYVIKLGPHVAPIDLCGSCYQDYHSGKLRYNHKTHEFGPVRL